VEDLVATFALLFIVAGKDGGLDVSQIATLLTKGLLLLVGLVLTNKLILPRVSKFMASTQELLFLFAISWGFGVASLFELSGFSIEVGALFAGVTLASLPYAQEITARLKPLRDFFVVLFFITLGESLQVSNLASGIVPALIFSAIVMVLKPLTITSVMGLLGYTKRVSFKAGINLSQISEFSIVLVVLAEGAGMVGSNLGAIVTLVAIITIASSTYLMHYDNSIFKRFDRIKLRLFEKEVVYKEKRSRSGYPLVLFGYQHGGHEFVSTFSQMSKRYVVVDYDPTVIDSLEHMQVPYIYGDATDMELLEEIGIDSAKLVVSTFTDYEVTKQLVQQVSRINPSAIVICHAENTEEALELYSMGATYVMIPHFLGSEKISSFIRKSELKKTQFDHYRQKHLAYLQTHFGPEVEPQQS
jgi:voltage-gated potassium channel Kch